MLRALFVLLLPSSGNGIRRRNQLWALITPHRQINKYLIWTPKSDFIILLMGLKCFFQTRQYLRTMFLQKDYPEKKIVCTSDENMRTHEQNSKIVFVINLYKLRKFFGKQYRERKKKLAIYGNWNYTVSDSRVIYNIQYPVQRLAARSIPQRERSFINIFTRPCSSPIQDSSVITYFKLVYTSI